MDKTLQMKQLVKTTLADREFTSFFGLIPFLIPVELVHFQLALNRYVVFLTF